MAQQTARVVPMNAGVTPMATWPIPGDVPDLKVIVHDQAQLIADQAVLIDAYQAVLNNASAVPPATAQGTSTNTTSLTLASVAGGPILNGAVITGTGVPANTNITFQQSGTPGGNGVYTTNQPTTLTNVALTITPGGGVSPWPAATDAPTLMTIQQDQTAMLRTQTALLQNYIDLFNDSNTQPPATGP